MYAKSEEHKNCGWQKQKKILVPHTFSAHTKQTKIKTKQEQTSIKKNTQQRPRTTKKKKLCVYLHK